MNYFAELATGLSESIYKRLQEGRKEAMTEKFKAHQDKIIKYLSFLFIFIFLLASSYFQIKKFNTIRLSYYFYGILILLVSIPLHALLHEMGHLIAGLISGYHFIMFRLFSRLWINTENGLSRRKEYIPGVLGQALMTPPKKEKKVAAFFYHLGGVIINALTILLFIIFGQRSQDPFSSYFFYLSAGMAFYLILTNIFPFKGTDGYNLFYFIKKPKGHLETRKILFIYRDMVRGLSFQKLAERINLEEYRDFSQPNTATFYSIHAASHLERGEFNKANTIYEILWSHRDELFAGHLLNLTMNYFFTLLITDSKNPLIQKIKRSRHYKNYQAIEEASAFRILAAESLFLNKDYSKAEKLLEQAKNEIPYSATVSDEKLEKILYRYLVDALYKEKESLK